MFFSDISTLFSKCYKNVMCCIVDLEKVNNRTFCNILLRSPDVLSHQNNNLQNVVAL